MFIDKQLVMSEAQAITVAADSTNVIDFGAADLNIGQGNPLYVEVWLDTAFTTSASLTLTITLESSADNSTYNAVDKLVIMPATLMSSLLTPKQLVKMSLPENMKRYVKLHYAVSNTIAAGKINAFITIN